MELFHPSQMATGLHYLLAYLQMDLKLVNSLHNLLHKNAATKNIYILFQGMQEEPPTSK